MKTFPFCRVIFFQNILTKKGRGAKIFLVKYVFFDLDGTLIDSSKGIIRSFEYAFSRMGIAAPPKEILYDCIGPSLLEPFLRFFDGDRIQAEKGVKLYRERYAVKG